MEATTFFNASICCGFGEDVQKFKNVPQVERLFKTANIRQELKTKACKNVANVPAVEGPSQTSPHMMCGYDVNARSLNCDKTELSLYIQIKYNEKGI